MSLFLSGTFVWVLVCTILTSGGDSIENLTNFFNTSVVFFNFFTKYIFFSDRHDVKISSLFYWIFFFFYSFIWNMISDRPKAIQNEKKKKRKKKLKCMKIDIFTDGAVSFLFSFTHHALLPLAVVMCCHPAMPPFHWPKSPCALHTN